MRPIIEFCTNNMHHGTEALFKKLEQNPAAFTPEELETAVAAKIKEIEEMFDLLGE